MPGPRLRVVVVGGGIAALETVLALHTLAGDRVATTLVAPNPTFSLRALAVAVPFGNGPTGQLALADVMDEVGGRYVRAEVRTVDTVRACVRCADGHEERYDALVVAAGAASVPSLPSAITFAAHAPGAAASVAQAIEAGWARTVAFVVPPGCTWPLPLYELALLTAAEAAGVTGAALHLVTPEAAPLAVFGQAASDAVAARLAAAGFVLHPGVGTVLVGDHTLQVESARPLHVDRILALPVLRGRWLGGLPADADGFVPVDRDGRVVGLADVWAAGDGTSQPVKQGGIACQQADAIAAQLAARAGADVAYERADLVLRGRLFAGADDLYLQRTLGRDDSRAASEPLWDVPGKVVGRYLAPYLAAHGLGERRALRPVED